jgi:hypothetical protein
MSYGHVEIEGKAIILLIFFVVMVMITFGVCLIFFKGG